MPIAEQLRGIVRRPRRVQGVGAPIEAPAEGRRSGCPRDRRDRFRRPGARARQCGGADLLTWGCRPTTCAELQRRARQKPPERPTLAEMSDDDLVARFKDAAERESGTHFLDYLEDPADKDLQNEIVVEVWDIMRQLKARGLLVTASAAARQRRSHRPARGGDRLPARRRAAGRSGARKRRPRRRITPTTSIAREALASWRDKGQIVYGV